MQEITSDQFDDAERLKDLLLMSLFDGDMNPSQRKELDQLLSSHPAYQKLYDQLHDEFSRKKLMDGYNDTIKDGETAYWDFLNAVDLSPMPTMSTRGHRNGWKIGLSIAASLILIIVCAALFALYEKDKINTSASIADILPPKGNHVLLTLSNGKALSLDSLANGAIASQGAFTVRKASDSSLIYEKKGESEENTIGENTLSTPRGGFYHITLPDGSVAYLNALSSIKYPTAFIGKSRAVSITGEVYLEIKDDPRRPFTVHAGSQDILVLGTHFDVMAYDDENSQAVTLLQGAVRVSSGILQPQLLKPGEKAVTENGKIKIIDNVDLDQAIAWKSRIFEFNNTDLRTIMRQLSRFYEAEVVYDGPVSSDLFTAYISRGLPVSKVLHLLEQTKVVTFKVEGNKIIVNSLMTN